MFVMAYSPADLLNETNPAMPLLTMLRPLGLAVFVLVGLVTFVLLTLLVLVVVLVAVLPIAALVVVVVTHLALDANVEVLP